MIVEIMNINADKTNTANASIISMINTLNIIPNVSDIISDNFFYHYSTPLKIYQNQANYLL